tara:strand:+ start:100 stop:420 length:321 start_codon:yes stop_codon:yes gene_type:complete
MFDLNKHMAKPISVVIKKSNKPEKKLMAIFQMDNGRSKTTHFGQSGAADYTLTKDKERRRLYLERHGRGRENWNSPTTAGALSRWILWNLPSRSASISAFKKKFKL